MAGTGAGWQEVDELQRSLHQLERLTAQDDDAHGREALAGNVFHGQEPLHAALCAMTSEVSRASHSLTLATSLERTSEEAAAQADGADAPVDLGPPTSAERMLAALTTRLAQLEARQLQFQEAQSAKLAAGMAACEQYVQSIRDEVQRTVSSLDGLVQQLTRERDMADRDRNHVSQVAAAAAADAVQQRVPSPRTIYQALRPQLLRDCGQLITARTATRSLSPTPSASATPSTGHRDGSWSVAAASAGISTAARALTPPPGSARGVDASTQVVAAADAATQAEPLAVNASTQCAAAVDVSVQSEALLPSSPQPPGMSTPVAKEVTPASRQRQRQLLESPTSPRRQANAATSVRDPVYVARLARAMEAKLAEKEMLLLQLSQQQQQQQQEKQEKHRFSTTGTSVSRDLFQAGAAASAPASHAAWFNQPVRPSEAQRVHASNDDGDVLLRASRTWYAPASGSGKAPRIRSAQRVRVEPSSQLRRALRSLVRARAASARPGTSRDDVIADVTRVIVTDPDLAEALSPPGMLEACRKTIAQEVTLSWRS